MQNFGGNPKFKQEQSRKLSGEDDFEIAGEKKHT